MSEAAKAEIVLRSSPPNPYDKPEEITPMGLIQLAVTKGTDVGQLEKLFDLQLRWEANEAKKAFVKALNDFKAEPPIIVKDGTGSYENKDKTMTAYDHATLDQVCDKVGAGLARSTASRTGGA